MNLLITGGAGFIGSCFVRLLLEDDHSDLRVINLDLLTYCGSRANLEGVWEDSRHIFIRGDICNQKQVNEIFQKYAIDRVVHFASESHVDRSIVDSYDFIRTNVLGTQVLLEVARKFCVKLFVQISTDEVYGSLGDQGYFDEETPLNPSSPYSASKAAADLLCLAYFRTYNFPVVIARSCNNYGPYQYPEKLIPVLIEKAKQNKALPIYGDGKNVRTWIHVRDNCQAIKIVMEGAKPGSIYNISSGEEQNNLFVAQFILKKMGREEGLIEFVKDRPGHDWRYALSGEKMKRDFNWSAKIPFLKGLEKTILWYNQNQGWLENIRKG